MNNIKKHESFNIKVHDTFYIIKPHPIGDDRMKYEVTTNCQYIFTLVMDDYGLWKTHDKDVIPITDNLVEDIGNAIEEHETKPKSNTN